MADGHGRGWQQQRKAAPGGWGRLPTPSSLPVPTRSAGLAPEGTVPPPGGARRVRGRHARGTDEDGPDADVPLAGGAPTPPAAPPLPKVVPLGDDLALVAMGRWDEETATIRLPIIPPEESTHAR